MNLTFGTFITNIFFSSILMLLVAILLKGGKFAHRRTISIYLVCTILCIIRLLLPVEFFFSTSIGDAYVLPIVYSFLKADIIYQEVKVVDLLLFIWLGGALVKSITIFRKHLYLKELLRLMPEVTFEKVYDILASLGIKKGQIKVIQIDTVSPSIIGIVKPIIVLPDLNISDKELYYILKHEVQHYRHHDLWLKALCELTAVLYWWNPLTALIGKQVNIITEIHNDLTLTGSLDSWEETEYLQSLLNVARKTVKSRRRFSLAFIENDETQIIRRFHAISNPRQPCFYHKLIALIIPVMILISYFIIIEPEYPLPLSSHNCYTLEELSNCPVLYENGNYYIIVNGEKSRISSPENLK